MLKTTGVGKSRGMCPRPFVWSVLLADIRGFCNVRPVVPDGSIGIPLATSLLGSWVLRGVCAIEGARTKVPGETVLGLVFSTRGLLFPF